MQPPLQLRTDLIKSVTHIRDVSNKIRANSGPHKPLTAPDSHKIAEGLFLSGVAHWEEFCQALLTSDLALQSTSALRKDVRLFKSNAARDRLAEIVVSHLDHPNGFYNWSEFSKIHSRALSLLGTTNRFNVVMQPVPPGTEPKNQPALSAFANDLTDFKVIRNAIAHKNDKAWEAFIRLVKRAPYSLTASQRKGITPGRFVIAHSIGGNPILVHALNRIEQAAFVLVP